VKVRNVEVASGSTISTISTTVTRRNGRNGGSNGSSLLPEHSKGKVQFWGNEPGSTVFL
jgi:hypothetical protein